MFTKHRHLKENKQKTIEKTRERRYRIENSVLYLAVFFEATLCYSIDKESMAVKS